MKIQFLGTKGSHKLISKNHQKTSSVLISFGGTVLAIDCGFSWKGTDKQFEEADALLLTHGHYDHSGGLLNKKDRPKIPVYATEATWVVLEKTTPFYKKYKKIRKHIFYYMLIYEWIHSSRQYDK